MGLTAFLPNPMGSLAIQPNSLRAYALAMALLIAALLAQWALRPLVGSAVPFLFLFPAIGIAAMYGGWRPALLVVLGGVVNTLYWLEPTGKLQIGDPAAQIALAGYLVSGGLLVAMGGRVSQLRAQAAGLELALETSAVPFCLLSPQRAADGQIASFRWRYLNNAAARMLGVPSPGEVAGKPVRDTIGRAQLEPGLLGRVLEAVRSRATVQFETWAEAEGRRRWFHVIASPHEEDLAVWFADITQRKRHEQLLQDGDRRKDEFLATLAHELRNPLAPIRQAAMIAKSPAARPEQKARSYEVIERQVSHMARLLDDLLDVSRITRGKLELRRERVHLRQIVDAALETVQPLAQARRQSLRVDLPAGPVWLDGDPVRLAQVLSNLLGNAVRYTPEGGSIQLTAERVEGAVRLAIRDNGAGIAPDSLERIFEMFTQVRGRDGAGGAGLGIGLALSRGLVELHGGSVVAHSEGLGRGSTFTVELPAAPAPAEAAPDTGGTPAAARTRRVLVADDNRDAAQSLADLLRIEGHEVTVAFDGEQALAEYQRIMPEVALLDIGMPGLTGNQVASAIRARPEGADTLLVAITGWGQERDREAARQAGFDAHFTKPVDPMQVLQLLSR